MPIPVTNNNSQSDTPDFSSVVDVGNIDSSPVVHTSTPDWSNVSAVETPKPKEKEPGFLSKLAMLYERNTSVGGMRLAIGAYEDLKNHPEKYPKDMSPSDFLKKANEAADAKAKEIELGGVMNVLSPQIDAGMMAMSVAQPAKALKLIAGFSIKDHFFNARRFIDKHFPDASPDVKDIAEIGDTFLTVGALEGAPWAYKKAIALKSMQDLKRPMSANIHPDRFEDLMTTPDLKDSERADILQKLGVQEKHVAAAKDGNLNINVDANRILDLTKEPYWDKAKVILGMGKYVRNSPIDFSIGLDDKATSETIRKEYTGVMNEQVVRINQLAEEIKSDVRKPPEAINESTPSSFKEFLQKYKSYVVEAPQRIASNFKEKFFEDFGLSETKKQAIVKTPAGDVKIQESHLNKIMESGDKTRKESIPFIKPTLTNPTEVLQDGNERVYLKLMKEGNHKGSVVIVKVAKDGNFYSTHIPISRVKAIEAIKNKGDRIYSVAQESAKEGSLNPPPDEKSVPPLSKKVKEANAKLQEEGMTLYADAGGNTVLLRQALQDAEESPEKYPMLTKYKPQIEAALNLSKESMSALKKGQEYYKESGEVSVQNGVLKQLRENYNNRMWKPEKPVDFVKTEIRAGLKRTTSHALRRSYDTIIDGMRDGLEPQTLTYSDLLSIHGEEMARVNTARKLADTLADRGLFEWHKSKNIPDGWEQVGTMKKSIPIQDESGKAVIGKDGNQVYSESVLTAPKGIAKGLRAITDPNFMPRLEELNKIKKYQGLVKTGKLSYSFFHHFSMAAQTAYQGGIRALMQIPVMDKILEGESFKEIEQDFVRHTGMTSKIEANQDILRNLIEKDDKDWYSKLTNQPIVKKILSGAEGNSRYLFDHLQRFLKVTDFGTQFNNWWADNPEASYQEIVTAKRGIAKQINIVYGGLNWAEMGITKTQLNLMRLGLLAPDWTISNVELLKYAIADKGVTGELSRKHILTAFLGGMALTEGLNKMLTGHFTDKNKKGHQLEVEVSPDVYVSLLRGGIGDISKLSSMLTESGLPGAARFAQGKLSPIASTMMGFLENVKYSGVPITKRGENALMGTYDYLMYGLAGITPTPIGGANLADYISSEKNKTFQGGLLIASGIARYSKGNEKAEHMDFKKKLSEQFGKTKDASLLDKAVANDRITLKEKRDIIRESKLDPIQKRTEHMAIDKIEELYKSAPDFQKKEIEKILRKKRASKKRSGDWSKSAETAFAELLNQ